MTRIFIFLILISLNCMADTITDSWRLRYDERGLPLIDVKIADRYHTLMLDTGSGQGLHLYLYNLEAIIANPSIDAIKITSRRMIDITGLDNNIPVWKIDKLRISNTIFHNVEAAGFKPWGLTVGGKQPISEVLGLGIFQDQKILIDFKNDKLKTLENLPANIQNWSSFPIKKTDSGLRISVNANQKKLNLIIDTAASHSFLFSDRLPKNMKFSGCRSIEPEASNLDCTVAKITLKDNKDKITNSLAMVTNSVTPKELDFDGLLGMNFMRGHQIIIDTKKQILYLRK